MKKIILVSMAAGCAIALISTSYSNPEHGSGDKNGENTQDSKKVTNTTESSSTKCNDGVKTKVAAGIKWCLQQDCSYPSPGATKRIKKECGAQGCNATRA